MALLSYQSIGLQNLFKASSRDDAIQVAFIYPFLMEDIFRATLKARYSEYDLAVGQYNRTILTALQQVADQLAHTYFKNSIERTNGCFWLWQSNYHRNYLLYKRASMIILRLLLAQVRGYISRCFYWN